MRADAYSDPVSKPIHIPRIAIFDYFPYGYRKENGEIDGVFIQFIEAIEASTGQKFEKRLLPFSRTVKEATEGTSDFLISYKDPKMAINMDFLGMFACAQELMVTARSAMVHSLTELKGARVAFPRSGYFHLRHADNLEIQAVPYTRPDALLQLLSINRINGMAISDWVLFAYTRPPNGQIKVHEDFSKAHEAIGHVFPLTDIPMALSINRESVHLPLGADLKKTMHDLRQKNVFKDILEAYNIVPLGTCEHDPISHPDY